MESQFGIAHVWAQGDFVTRSVAILLLLMSVASWAVIVIKTLALLRLKNKPGSPAIFGTAKTLRWP